MKVLLVGGSGHVGTLVTPYLKEHHQIHVLDPVPPRHSVARYVQGSITDIVKLRDSLADVDTFVSLVMKDPREETVPAIINHYQLNVLGIHLLLKAAFDAGVAFGVHTSTVTVHKDRNRYQSEEATPLDEPGVYGFTKGIGESICQHFARWFDMNIIALRITGPRSRQEWLEERQTRGTGGPKSGIFVTDEEDLANAYLAAIEKASHGHGRFDAYYIAGDEGAEKYNLSKARWGLGWQPMSHLLLDKGTTSGSTPISTQQEVNPEDN